MNKQIKDILIEKTSKNKLAHLYLVEPNKHDNNEFIQNWIFDFLKSAHSLKTLENHPDILILNSNDNAKQYSSDHLREINEFVNYKASELEQKYLVIPHFEQLTVIHCNKLLKLFEEPPIALTIFLLNPSKSKVLDTIKSRAQKLRITLNTTQESFFLSKLDNPNVSFVDFNADVDKNNISIPQLLSELLILALKNKASLKILEKIQSQIMQTEQAMAFNNSKRHALINIYNLYNELK